MFTPAVGESSVECRLENVNVVVTFNVVNNEEFVTLVNDDTDAMKDYDDVNIEAGHDDADLSVAHTNGDGNNHSDATQKKVEIDLTKTPNTFKSGEMKKVDDAIRETPFNTSALLVPEEHLKPDTEIGGKVAKMEESAASNIGLTSVQTSLISTYSVSSSISSMSLALVLSIVLYFL